MVAHWPRSFLRACGARLFHGPLTPVPPVTGRDEPWPGAPPECLGLSSTSDVITFDQNSSSTSAGGKDLSNDA